MQELTTARKIKINLADYDFESDIKNRLLISRFNSLDIAVLEEILFSPLKIPLENFISDQNLAKDPEKILSALKKLEKTKLLTLQGQDILIDKNVRKYFDLQILAFEDDFQPNIEFIHHLLKKVSIHVLPPWYALPKNCSNIFQSIIDKFLATPAHFQRHLEEIKQKSPLFKKIIEDVYSSCTLQVKAEDLKASYGLSDFDFHKTVLLLEFSFVLCLNYRKKAGKLEEILTPFWEWGKYLKFLKDSEPSPIKKAATIRRDHEEDFGFLKDFSAFLNLIGENPLFYDIISLSKTVQKQLQLTTSVCTRLLPKALFLKLAEIVNGKLKLSPAGEEFKTFSLKKKSLAFLETPAKFMPFSNQQIKAAASSINRALNYEWLDLEQFIKGIVTPLKEGQAIKLKKTGKNFSYQLPRFSDDEKKFFKHVIGSYLYEAGITATGSIMIDSGKFLKCFKVTDFGKQIFAV